jgi:hypothetical protein
MAKPQVRKADLVNILVDNYGYEKEDLKFDAEGKLYTNAKLQAMIKAEEQDAKELEVESTRKVHVKSKIKEDDRIVVMSGINSVGYFSERSNRRWKFTKFGQQDLIEYSELVAMRNKYPAYFTQGWIIVLDKAVQEEFNLTEMYKNILTPENIDDVFNMDVEGLDRFIEAMPEGQKQSLVNNAVERYEANALNNFQVIKYIQDKFNFSFEDNAPLGDIVASVETGVNNIIYVDKK